MDARGVNSTPGWRFLVAQRRSRSFIELVADRPGHDFRYEVNYAKARDELGWRPLVPFVPGVRETVAWYLANRE